MKLPDGWKEVKLGDYIALKNGLNFSQDFNGVEINFLGVGNFKNNKKIRNESELDKIYLAQIPDNDYLLRKDDLVFVRSNGSKELVGRCVIIDNSFDKMTYSGFCIRGRLISREVTSYYIATLIEAGFLRRKLKKENRGTNISNLNQEILSDLTIPLPPLPEQKAIADTLSVWDSMIEKMEKLIDEKEKKYSRFMGKVFSVKGKKGQVLVKKIAQEVSVRNSSLSVTQVLSVTNKNGFVLPEEQFSKHVASNDLSNYKVVKKRQFAYNPSRINVGSIARLDNWDNAVLSPMYTVFEIKEDVVNSDYFLHWLHSYKANQKIKTCAQGGVRAIVNFSDFASISLYVPEKRKQDEIADVLNSMQKEITLLRQLADEYKLQKRGLMQKLLTGQWRIK